MEKITALQRRKHTPGSSPNPDDIRLGVENKSRELISFESTHPDRWRHPLQHFRFDVPPGHFVELPHRLYNPTVPSGEKFDVGLYEGADLKRAKDKHSARFVYRID